MGSWGPNGPILVPYGTLVFLLIFSSKLAAMSLDELIWPENIFPRPYCPLCSICIFIETSKMQLGLSGGSRKRSYLEEYIKCLYHAFNYLDHKYHLFK